MPFDVGGPQFGLADAKIARWTSAGTYGTAVDLMSIQMLGVTLQQISAQLTGDDSITAQASRATGAQVQSRIGGLGLDWLTTLTGRNIQSSSSGTRQIGIPGGHAFPYVGIIGKSLGEEGGDTWVFIPKAKIASDFTIFQGQYGEFTIPEVTLQAVADSMYGILNIITHPAEMQITTFPPPFIAQVS